MLYALGALLYLAPVRSTGLGITMAWSRVGAVLSSYTDVLSLKLGGGYAYFGLILTALLLAAIAALSISLQLGVDTSQARLKSR